MAGLPAGEVLLVDITAGTKRATVLRLDEAVGGSKPVSQAGLRDRLFAAAFQGLVYPQIWEDPVVDLEALAIKPGDHIVAIASGGCNIMSYLTADPGRITALDLNHAHIALNKLKLAAARFLPSYRHFADFFAQANQAANPRHFDEYIAPNLDGATRRYWQGRDVFGRRRIAAFAHGFYSTGLLGRFIGASHFLCRVLGVDISAMTKAKSLREQQDCFDNKLAPIFDHWLLRTLLRHPASLYGLGIPPAQYAALAGDHPGGLPEVLRQRARKLACTFPLKDNYFAQQAFGRGYDLDGALPPYLEAANFEAVRARANRVDVRHESMTEFLAQSTDGSVDGFVLLDAQDWMDSGQLTALWRQISRCAAPGARVIFRTAANERLLPGKIPAEILSGWDYHAALSKDLDARDRSSIYGAFHLYTRNGEAVPA
jgi:S-adenosylmethionine-diacylglycerol 3-amino-3-carboxypropyl transferase